MDRSDFYRVFFEALDAIPPDRRGEFEAMVMPHMKNPVVIFGASAWLGAIGLDRFLLGQVWLGVLKLLTLGGLGIWRLIDYFLVSGEARRQNAELVQQARARILGGAGPGFGGPGYGGPGAAGGGY